MAYLRFNCAIYTRWEDLATPLANKIRRTREIAVRIVTFSPAYSTTLRRAGMVTSANTPRRSILEERTLRTNGVKRESMINGEISGNIVVRSTPQLDEFDRRQGRALLRLDFLGFRIRALLDRLDWFLNCHTFFLHSKFLRTNAQTKCRTAVMQKASLLSRSLLPSRMRRQPFFLRAAGCHSPVEELRLTNDKSTRATIDRASLARSRGSETQALAVSVKSFVR